MAMDYHMMVHKAFEWKKIVLGLLILLNVYWLNWNWAVFIGAILILAGLLGLIKPMCWMDKKR